MVADGLIDVDRLVTHRYPLEKVAQAYDLVASRADGVMKVIVEVSK
jgi:threonine dehydrogenase-like Zn-dependent dehydrogenase